MPPPTTCSPDDQRRPGRYRGHAASDSMPWYSLWLDAKSNGLWSGSAPRLYMHVAISKRSHVHRGPLPTRHLQRHFQQSA